VGDGRYKDTLIEMVRSIGVDDMFNFIPKQPADRIPEFMAACDSAFLCLTNSPLFAMTIPAKLQSYMACGIPIISSSDGETNQIIKDSNCGLSSPAGDVEKLSYIIVDMASKSISELGQLGKNARVYYEENFNKVELMNRMDKNFDRNLNLEGNKIVQ